MTERITGQQARELLRGTTTGPWWVGIHRLTQGDNVLEARRTVCPPGTTEWLAATDDLRPAAWRLTTDADLELMAAAPALAETVIRLHERIEQIEADRDTKTAESNRWQDACRIIAEKLAKADNAVAKMCQRHTD